MSAAPCLGDSVVEVSPGCKYNGCAMADHYQCAVCDQIERECKCDRYCTLCLGFHDVRLCQDGSYYCLECREACDYQAEH